MLSDEVSGLGEIVVKAKDMIIVCLDSSFKNYPYCVKTCFFSCFIIMMFNVSCQDFGWYRSDEEHMFGRTYN